MPSLMSGFVLLMSLNVLAAEPPPDTSALKINPVLIEMEQTGGFTDRELTANPLQGKRKFLTKVLEMDGL